MGHLGRDTAGREGRLALLNRGKREARHALVRAMHGRLAARNAGRRRQRGSAIQRILVLRPDHLGDLLFATPALQSIRQAFPQAQITGAVGPWGRAMWADNPNLYNLEVIPFPGIVKISTTPLHPYNLLGEYARKLAHGQYDLGIVLRFDHWWGAALLWAAGIPRRWGYDTPGTAPWLTNKVPYIHGRHEVEQDLMLAQAVIAGINHPGDIQRVRVSRDDGEPPLRTPGAAPLPEGLLSGWLDTPRRAVIHPGTAAANKLWTIPGWAETAIQLTERGWSVAITGSPGEKALAEAIMAEIAAPGKRERHAIMNIAGQTAGIAQLVWVLGHAQVVLGVDSGPLHIADALCKPTLHLYGPSDEQIWGPWGNPHKHRAFRAPGTHPTMHLEVGSLSLEGGPEMQAITPAMVLCEIDELARNLQD